MMSERKSPPRKDKACSSSLHNIAKTPQSTSKTESNKLLKRKLFSPGHTTDDEEKKGSSIPKRRRSVHVETGSPPPVTSGCSSSGSGSSTGAVSGGSKTPGRQAPLSERQQIAKIMQQYAAEETHHGDLSPRHPSASPPHSAGKRTPFDKKMNKRNEKGETMLHVAAIRGDIKLTKRLIKAKADVNVTDNAGWTPLHEACNHGHFSIAKQLLKNGANVNVLGLENDTPLHDASVNGHTKLIQLLLRHGANPLQCNMAGKAPTDVARDESILKLLKSDINASSSGSESVTSEIRSPTSPESNMSEDEDDGKKKKVPTATLR